MKDIGNFRLETDRLYLRVFVPSDAQGFYALNADEEVMRYTGDLPFESVEEAGRFIQAYDHYQRHGYGRWTVLDKQTGTYLGFCGLKHHADKKEVDIGFRLLRQYWGRGLATEAARACLDYGFKEQKMACIVGRAQSENAASLRVLQKLGMRYCFDFVEDAQDWKHYELKNPHQ
ncbi:MAG: GNAT family N-acetyltransferase [Bacteroidota bacterium]